MKANQEDMDLLSLIEEEISLARLDKLMVKELMIGE
jgi:hypothetical protein